MIEQPGNAQPSGSENEEADKVFLTGDSSLQSPAESQEKKDDYYEVDEKKLVTTNIGDGSPHEEGLAGVADSETGEDQ
jgi:hypothetical protein